ncbi:MAG: peroxiredoxin family protein [Planctomycetaceae bacterium]
MKRFPQLRRLLAAAAVGSITVIGRLAEAAEPTPPAPGHSYHGEAFNEGPRQRACLIGHTGSIRFAATTASAQAQAFINQGLGQLHGFWYFEAERSFRQAALLDPECAIAYWGMAQANANNEKRAKGFLAEAVKRKAGASEREALYIEALDAFYHSVTTKGKEKDNDKDTDRLRYEAYSKALERIVYKFPDDIEAKALLGLQLWQNRTHHSPIASHLAVDALLKEVLAVEPMHPCHHYRIHLWDQERPEMALGSAARCGPAAPAIAHMWHMPGHTYSKLERYADAAWQQEASARVDHAYMLRDRILPDQIHNYAHNNEWLVRNLGHLGRARDAVAIAKNLCEAPRHPTHNTLKHEKSAHFGRLRLFDELTRFELWDELIALCDSPYLEPTDLVDQQVRRLRRLGAALLRSGRADRGQAVLDELLRLAATERGIAETEGRRPEPVALPTAEDGSSPRKSEAARQRDDRLHAVDSAIDEVLGHLAVVQGKLTLGLGLLRNAEGVDPLYLARLNFVAGQRQAALDGARATVASKKNEAQPLAGLVEMLWLAGERQEAAERFAALREIAGAADLDAPPFARLTSVARELGYPADWRLPRPAAADVGDRPTLDSLGPARWTPPPAPEWTSVDITGRTRGFADFRGRPHIVLFFLGNQCLHCAEQLQKFAPVARHFNETGVSLVAISTDDREGLQKSLEDYKPGTMPLELLSDHELRAFRAYRAYDDFEQRPMHATFLIDGQGAIRWQDISHEPFQDVDFLLGETKRLLALPLSAETRSAEPLGLGCQADQ